MTDLPLARLAHNIEPRRRLGPYARLLPLPAVAARLFVSFRGVARNGFRARQSCASIPAYRDMQLEAHRIQNTQNGFEIWMPRIAFKGAIDRRSFKPGYFGDVGDVVPTNGGTDGMTYFVDVRGPKARLMRSVTSRRPGCGRIGALGNLWGIVPPKEKAGIPAGLSVCLGSS